MPGNLRPRSAKTGASRRVSTRSLIVINGRQPPPGSPNDHEIPAVATQSPRRALGVRAARPRLGVRAPPPSAPAPHKPPSPQSPRAEGRLHDREGICPRFGDKILRDHEIRLFVRGLRRVIYLTGRMHSRRHERAPHPPRTAARAQSCGSQAELRQPACNIGRVSRWYRRFTLAPGGARRSRLRLYRLEPARTKGVLAPVPRAAARPGGDSLDVEH